MDCGKTKKGSHIRLQKRTTTETLKLTVPAHRPIKRTTLSRIIKQARLTIRLPESMLEELKLLANKRDVPYQSLVKVFLSDRIEQELMVKRGHNKSLHRIADKSGSR